MLRILFFLILVFALGLGFAWLAERPGTMIVTFNGYEYQVTLMVAAVIVTALVAAMMILWWLLKSIWTSPQTVARYFRVRRRDRGYQSLSTGLIAAGAGDADSARKLHRQSSKFLSSNQEPLLHLLEAQTSLLDGDHDAARKKFEAMLDDPEMRLIGLRGLYLEAERLGDRGVARHYAERANKAAPQLSWAAHAALEARMADGDWDGAIRILDAQKATRQLDREQAARDRAVLLTAKADSLLASDVLAARNAAVEANRLDPALVPAAITAAKALFRQDDLRKGSKILEAAWKREPHPEIADIYVHARPGDSTQDRLKRARRLAELKPNNVESSVALARASLEAGEFKAAREAAETAARLAPREGVYLLLADIEEAETGDLGRVREWLARAVRAPRDPAWTADGFVSERWAPFSPVTGRLGAFEWKVPVERIGRTIEQRQETAPVEREPKAIAPVPSAPIPAGTVAGVAEAEVMEAEVVKAAPTTESSVAPPASNAAPKASTALPQQPAGADGSRAAAPASGAVRAASSAIGEPTGDKAAAAPPQPKPDNVTPFPGAADGSPPPPDDPGVDPDDEDAKAAKRFRLF